MISVLHILVCEVIIRWQFMAVWAFVSTGAVSFSIEGTKMGSVTLVVRVCPRELLQHLFSSRDGPTRV